MCDGKGGKLLVKLLKKLHPLNSFLQKFFMDILFGRVNKPKEYRINTTDLKPKVPSPLKSFII